MLKILWVEDEYSKQKQVSWFNNRPVCLKPSFDEAESAINRCLTQFDLIVLDINLESSEHTDRVKALAKQFKIAEKEFLQESGMNLFLNLLEHGFPKEQIIFLTANADINISRIDELRESYRLGNDDVSNEILGTITNGLSEETVIKCAELVEAEDIEGLCQYLEKHFNDLEDGVTNNTYNRFCEAYRRCRIEPPKAINKSLNEAKQHLNHWLESHERNDYLVLRRGIIKGCNFLKKHIKDDDNNIQFRSFVKDTKSKNPAIEILPDDIKNYLDTVEQFLPARQPTVINDTYRLFLRTLVHEWEESIDPQKTTEKHGGDIHTFAWLSKQTRNWVSHAKLLEPLNSEIIAFLFLVNMRAMFKLPVEVQEYEHILLKCISKAPPVIIDDDNLDSCIKASHDKVDEILSSLNIPLDKEIKDKNEDNKTRRKYFSEKINDIYRDNTRNSKQRDYQDFLFQYFWVNQQVYQSNLTANSDDFLPTLARHIYKRSFLKGEKS